MLTSFQVGPAAYSTAGSLWALVGGSGGVLLWHLNQTEASFPHLAVAQRKRLEIAGGPEAAGMSAPQSGAWSHSQRGPEREGIFSQQGLQLAEGYGREMDGFSTRALSLPKARRKPSCLSARLRSKPTL